MEFEPVIGLEIHAELQTQSKMFCACKVVDSTQAEPNTSVCPVCSGMPGTLPILNRRAVEYALRVALALECDISPYSIFARKNYFYPDLPKGYQISQYEQPLARNGRLQIITSEGERTIRVRRVHLEEDTGKLSHIAGGDDAYSLIDLNRAGVPLLEIVTEPDLHRAEEVRAFASALRSILRYLGVNSGEMEKGVMRIEPNISVRQLGSTVLGTRTEIKNLNSFRALERSVDYEIRRQAAMIERGEQVLQETRGWNEAQEITVLQRRKEAEDDYRYFPEPDLPPLTVDTEWLEEIRSAMPELPIAKWRRFQQQYQLNAYDAGILTDEQALADYFEQAALAVSKAAPKIVANWITGDLFGLMNQSGCGIEEILVSPHALADLIRHVIDGELNQGLAKSVLADMFSTGKSASQVVSERGLKQISDVEIVSDWVRSVLSQNIEQVDTYFGGKEGIWGWLFGQVMRVAKGQADPQVVKKELNKQLDALRIQRET